MKFSLSTFFKPYLPKSLLGRSVLIIVMPLVLLQLVSATIFFENHWKKVGRRLALGVTGEIAFIIDAMRETNRAQISGVSSYDPLFKRAETVWNFKINYIPDGVVPDLARLGDDILVGQLTNAMDEMVQKPHRIDAITDGRQVEIQVQLARGVLQVTLPRKRLFSTTTYMFVLLMAGTSLLLFSVAMIFMRNQIRPITRLARAAKDFGMGRDSPRFKPEGATEVRRASGAFIAMRNRIKRQIQQRTDMLAGVSHDLRTPLTRMKLQLEMMGDDDGVTDLKTDIADMEHMLDEYLAFARGEGGEGAVSLNLSQLLDEIVVKARRKGGAIDLHCEGEIFAPVKANALNRALTNLIDNAVRYGDNLAIRAGVRGEVVEINIDDDGPGISENMREDVFKPFIRLDTSRNPVTGGVGLGMTIARDVVRGHGGDIKLEDAPGGGLRAKVTLPI